MKLQFLLMILSSVSPALGAIANQVQADIANKAFTLREDVSIATQLMSYVGGVVPAENVVLVDATKLLQDAESAFETIEPDVQKIIADLKAKAAAPAKVSA